MRYKYIIGGALAAGRHLVDCCTTGNFDEKYAALYPKLNVVEVTDYVTRYPVEIYDRVRRAISEAFTYSGDIVLGGGSEELIVRLNNVLVRQGKVVGVVTPIFYRIPETVDLDGTSIALSENDFFSGEWDEQLQAIWIQNPNMFSGRLACKEEILKIVDSHPKILFMIDEAAVLIYPDWRNKTLLYDVSKRDNLIVLHSFSKMFGLSGMRIGFASGSGELCEILRMRGPTFPIAAVSGLFLESVLSKVEVINDIRARIAANVEDMRKLIVFNGGCSVSSVANCLIFSREGKRVVDDLEKVGILAMDLDPYRTEMGLARLTVHSSSILHAKVSDLVVKALLS